MGFTCFVLGCDSSQDTLHSSVTFHRVPPKKVAMYHRIARLEFAGDLESFSSGIYKYRICSRHFKLTDFIDNVILGIRTLKPGAQPNQTAITLAEEEQRSAELYQMRILRRQQRRSSTSGTGDQPAPKMKKKLKHVIMKKDSPIKTNATLAEEEQRCSSTSATKDQPTSKMKKKLKHVIMKKDSPLKRDVFLEQTARLSLPISLPSGTSSRSSAPHTITFPMSQERRAGIVFPQCIISNVPQRLIGFELPVPDIARGVTLEPQGTIYRTQQGTSIVQVLPPYSLHQEHNYGMPMRLVITSSGTTSTSTAETTTSSVQCPGAVLSFSETSTSCRPSIDVTSAVKVEVKDDYQQKEKVIDSDFDGCDLPTEHEDQDPEDMDYSLNMTLDTARSVTVSSEEDERSDVEKMLSQSNMESTSYSTSQSSADFTQSSDKVSDYDKLLMSALKSRPVVLLTNLELEQAASHSEHKNVTEQKTPTEQITPMCIKQEPDDMIPHIQGYDGQQDSIQTDMSLNDLKPTDVEITASTESFAYVTGKLKTSESTSRCDYWKRRRESASGEQRAQWNERHKVRYHERKREAEAAQAEERRQKNREAKARQRKKKTTKSDLPSTPNSRSKFVSDLVESATPTTDMSLIDLKPTDVEITTSTESFAYVTGKPKTRGSSSRCDYWKRRWESASGEQRAQWNERHKVRYHERKREAEAAQAEDRRQKNREAKARQRKKKATKSDLPSTPNSKSKFVSDLVESATPTTSGTSSSLTSLIM